MNLIANMCSKITLNVYADASISEKFFNYSSFSNLCSQ